MQQPSYYATIEAIETALFAAEHRRLDRTIEVLTQQNNEIIKTHRMGFVYQGTWYKPTKNQNVPSSERPMLDMSLNPQMELHLKDVAIIQGDKNLIKQVLFSLIHQANDLQELRDSVPDCIADITPNVERLPRQMEDVTWLIRNNARALRQFHKVLPKIEMYSATRLLY
jgi:hypothetical protein